MTVVKILEAAKESAEQAKPFSLNSFTGLTIKQPMQLKSKIQRVLAVPAFTVFFFRVVVMLTTSAKRAPLTLLLAPDSVVQQAQASTPEAWKLFSTVRL